MTGFFSPKIFANDLSAITFPQKFLNLVFIPVGFIVT